MTTYNQSKLEELKEMGQKADEFLALLKECDRDGKDSITSGIRKEILDRYKTRKWFSLSDDFSLTAIKGDKYDKELYHLYYKYNEVCSIEGKAEAVNKLIDFTIAEILKGCQ